MKYIASLILLLACSSLHSDFIRKSGGEEVVLNDSKRETTTSKTSFDGDFRSAMWEDSKEVVKSHEVWVLEEEGENYLAYSGWLLGYKAVAIYSFATDKLIRGNYHLIKEHTNKNLYIDDYFEIQSELKAKYGRCKEDIIWKNDLYRDDRSEYGFAVSLGHLVYQSSWHDYSSDILLLLTGDNYEIELIIQYKSHNHDKLKRSRRKQMNDL